MKKRAKKKNLSLPMLSAFRQKNGKRVKSNTTVKMSLKSLRRLVSAARSGKPAKVKARVR